MKLIRKLGATSQILQIFIADSSSSTGAGLTGLLFNTASLTAYYHRDTDTTATAISLVTMTTGTFTSSGFKEIDSTNMPGWYQFCPPNAALASGAASVALHLKGATNMAPLPIEVDLDAQVDVTSWNGTAVSSPATAGIPDINVKNINNVAAATPGASGGILISGSNSGTTTFGALTCTGSFTVSDGLLVSRSSSNTSAITATGNGTGSGIVATSGAGATGDGFQATAASTNGNGFKGTGVGTGAGGLFSPGATGNGIKCTGGATSGSAMLVQGTAGNAIGLDIQGQGSAAGTKSIGGATGSGLLIVGGATSGAGVSITTTSGDGISSTPTAGHGITATGQGTTKHGINATGGATTSDGIRATGGGVGNGINAISGAGATGDGIVGTASSTAGNGMTLTHSGTGKDFNATTTPLTLAKTTNITGFNDISAAAAATGVWQDTTSGDFTVASSIGKSLFTAGVVPGGAGGLFIAGSNAATTANITGNITGNLSGSVGSVTAAVAITSNTKKNQSLNAFMFLMTNASTGNPMTGLSITATRSIDGAAFGACANSAVEVSSGWYSINLAAADLNGNVIALRFAATLANDTDQVIVTQP